MRKRGDIKAIKESIAGRCMFGSWIAHDLNHLQDGRYVLLSARYTSPSRFICQLFSQYSFVEMRTVKVIDMESAKLLWEDNIEGRFLSMLQDSQYLFVVNDTNVVRYAKHDGAKGKSSRPPPLFSKH